MKKTLSFLLVIALLCTLFFLISGCDQHTANTTINIKETIETSSTSNTVHEDKSEDENKLNSFNIYGLQIALDESYTKISEGHDDSIDITIFENSNYYIYIYHALDCPFSATEWADAEYNDAKPASQEVSKKRGTANQTPWIALVSLDGQKVFYVYAYYAEVNSDAWIVRIYTKESFSGNLDEMVSIFTSWEIT